MTTMLSEVVAALERTRQVSKQANPGAAREIAALPVLAVIEAMQHQSRANLAGLATWAEHRAYIEELDALDLEAIAEGLASGLTETFGYWTDPKMTGDGGQRPIQAVTFEWGYEDPEYALAYGHGSCEPTRIAPIYGVDFIRWSTDDATFHDCGGLDVSAITAVGTASPLTEFVDYTILKVAELAHHAVARAATSEAFAAIAKRAPLHFLVTRHDRFPVLAYRWPADVKPA